MAIPFHGVTTVFHVKILNESLSVTAVLTGRQICDLRDTYFQVAQWFELVVFTASMEIYGQAVADKLDSNQGMLNRRYYRQHCTLDFGSYTKDLSAICADLSSVFILDNSPGAYRSYPGLLTEKRKGK